MVQRLLYRARMRVKLGASNAPHRKMATALFSAWDGSLGFMAAGPVRKYSPKS